MDPQRVGLYPIFTWKCVPPVDRAVLTGSVCYCFMVGKWGRVGLLQSLLAMTPYCCVTRPRIHIHNVLNIFCCDDLGLPSPMEENILRFKRWLHQLNPLWKLRLIHVWSSYDMCAYTLSCTGLAMISWEGKKKTGWRLCCMSVCKWRVIFMQEVYIMSLLHRS